MLRCNICGAGYENSVYVAATLKPVQGASIFNRIDVKRETCEAVFSRIMHCPRNGDWYCAAVVPLS